MLLCHLSEAIAAPLSLPRRSEAKAGRGDSPKHGDSERIREQAPRRGYSAIQYFNRLLTGFEPTFDTKPIRVIPADSCGNQRVKCNSQNLPNCRVAQNCAVPVSEFIRSGCRDKSVPFKSNERVTFHE